MALDTESKRWNMMQLATGVSAWSHVINPSSSDFDDAVERTALLNVYGGLLVSDTTAPVLSSPTGTTVDSESATGTVSTDEDNGTLYYYASQNPSELAAAIKVSGENQAVTTTGVQNVSVSGLLADTIYYLHYVQDDDATNESNVVVSTSFTTTSSSKRKLIMISGTQF
jgi:hypothetical protein